MDRPCLHMIPHSVSVKAKFFGVICWTYNKYFTDQACLIKVAGYWPCFYIFMDLDFVSVHKNAIKQKTKNTHNEANIKPSGPHTWYISVICSITIKILIIFVFLTVLSLPHFNVC